MHLSELKRKSVEELLEMADAMQLEGVARARKQEVIFAILKAHAMLCENEFHIGRNRDSDSILKPLLFTAWTQSSQ